MSRIVFIPFPMSAVTDWKPAEYVVFTVLHLMDGTADSLLQLAKVTPYKPGTVSGAVKRLKERGLVHSVNAVDPESGHSVRRIALCKLNTGGRA